MVLIPAYPPHRATTRRVRQAGSLHHGDAMLRGATSIVASRSGTYLTPLREKPAVANAAPVPLNSADSASSRTLKTTRRIRRRSASNRFGASPQNGPSVSCAARSSFGAAPPRLTSSGIGGDPAYAQFETPGADGTTDSGRGSPKYARRTSTT